jgi:hypothetical protein
VTTVSRLSFLGVRAAGTNIALFGGLAATIALMLSGMAGSILSVPDVSVSAPVVKAIYYLSFLCGGVLYAVGFGLLAAGMSVTTYFMRPLPRWLTILGILLAITGELCWFSPVAFPANFFIPITRYAGFIWMLLAASALTKDRRVVHAASAAVPSWTASGLRHKKQSSENYEWCAGCRWSVPTAPIERNLNLTDSAHDIECTWNLKANKYRHPSPVAFPEIYKNHAD